MTVLRGDAARSLMARTRSAGRPREHSSGVSRWSPDIDEIALRADRAPLPRRPDEAGCVEWMLACSQQEVLTGSGMAPSMVRELAALLERWHGSQASGIARSAAAAVAQLVAEGGSGRLRLSGTRGRLLVELICAGPPAPRAERAASGASSGTASERGSYRTFAETRREHIRWVSLLLPGRRHESVVVPSRTADDEWT